ncbi:MAG TPA: hypothetical protein VE991_00165, partial [Acidimicrobiales bacterium]|nr:hypothetical protein [Acidimicrobiales bacterium]
AHVLVGFGGNYGDCGAYNGWLVGVPTDGAAPLVTYKVPTDREGAIWAPGGPSVDDTGDVYVATGNGSAGPGHAFDHGDAVVALSPALAELGFFAPATWAQDSSTDTDLGSTTPVLLGGGLVFQIGKNGTAYLLHGAKLGGIGGQAASLSLCPSLGSTAYAGPSAFVVCTDSGQVKAVLVGAQGTLTPGFTWTSPTGGAGSPTVARGLLWTVDGHAGVLYGIDPTSGVTRYHVALRVGPVPHFAAPSAAGGLVLVAGTDAVEAFR